MCFRDANRNGLKYAGFESSEECWIGDDLDETRKVEDSECDL